MVNADELEKYKNHLEQLKRVQEAGKVGYWAVYAEKEYLEWSAETYKLYDLPIGQPVALEDWLAYIHPEDRNWVDERWQSATKDGEYAVVYRIISANQKIKWIEVNGDVVFDGEDNFVRALGIVRDITEQKEAEIKLATYASLLKRYHKIGNLGSFVFDAKSPYFDVNEETRGMFGFPRDLLVTTDEWMTTIHPEDRDRVWQIWSKATNGEGDFDLEYRIVVDDSVKWIKALGEMEFDPEGEFIRAVGVVKDITEHIAQQENLRLAKDQAEVANKLKSQFLANMSHEIRTPLNGVIGFSSLLMKSSLDEKQKHYMTIVNQSARSLIDIVNDILDFSKIEAGKLELAEDKVDLLELINKVKNIFSYQAQEKNIELWTETASNVPRYVIADGLRLQQVLVNLMSNAVKFTKDGEIELSVQLLNNNSQATNVFRFSVRDTGIGISPENQSKIFEAFTQEDLSTTKKFGGTGLGLSISKGILALMDSQLQLESERKKGSLFYFDLTLKPFLAGQADSTLSNSSDQSQEELTIDTELKSLVIKILVVEDNDVNIFLARALISNVLPKAIILVAENGKIAVELFQNDNPDLILMDLQMPVMNGYDATEKIREIEAVKSSDQEKQQRTPIIALTSGVLEQVKEKCLGVQMDDFMSKPLTDEMLKSLIKDYIFH